VPGGRRPALTHLPAMGDGHPDGRHRAGHLAIPTAR